MDARKDTWHEIANRRQRSANGYTQQSSFFGQNRTGNENASPWSTWNWNAFEQNGDNGSKTTAETNANRNQSGQGQRPALSASNTPLQLASGGGNGSSSPSASDSRTYHKTDPRDSNKGSYNPRDRDYHRKHQDAYSAEATNHTDQEEDEETQQFLLAWDGQNAPQPIPGQWDPQVEYYLDDEDAEVDDTQDQSDFRDAEEPVALLDSFSISSTCVRFRGECKVMVLGEGNGGFESSHEDIRSPRRL